MRRLLAVLSVLFGTMTMGIVSLPATASVAGADAPNAVYVSPTGSDSNPGTIGAPFATIQYAINAVASAGSVTVAAGTYNESLTIGKPVTLDGAQTGVDARTRSGAESVITGSGGVVYTAGATTGTIDGFTLQGYTGSTSEIKASDVGSGWDFSNDIIDVSYGGIYLNSDGVSDPAKTTINHDSFVQAIPSSASSGYYGGAVNMWSQAGKAADNVTVSDNNFTNLSGPTGAVHTGSNPSCTSATPGADPADFAKNLTVSGNAFTDTGNDENFLVAFCTSSAAVTDNTVTVNDPGDDANASTGMYLGGGNYDMQISSNTLTAVGLPAGAISLNSIFNPGGSGDVITGNAITGWTKGVQVAGGQSPAPTDFSVTDNNVSGASAYGVEVLTYEGAMPAGGSLSGNTASGSGTDDCYDNTTGSGTAGTDNTWSGNTGITSSPAGLCHPSSVYVSTSGNDANSGTATSPFATIGHALGVVASGGTVNVAAGTYDENVHITQPVTLLGANAGISGTSGSRGAESVISTSNAGSSQDLTVQVSSPGVTVNGFTIQQTAPTTCASCAAFGVQVDPNAAGATVTDNIISGMSSTQTAPTKSGNPIGVDVSGNGTGTPDNVTVSNNLIENISALGTQHISALGIEVGDSSVTHVGIGLVISGNHITGVSSAAWGAYGIIFNRPTSGSQVVGNTIDTISGFGWAHAIGLEGNETSPVITNNAISNVSSPSSDSVDIYSDSTNLGVATATITQNSLGGGAGDGIGNDSPGTLSAADNFWGCTTGPNTTVCSVTGGSGTFNLTPWIVSSTPDPAHAGQPGYWPTAIVSSTTPDITSSSTAVFQVGVAGTFTVTATGTPGVSLAQTGTLPAWLSFNATTGVLSGTPTASGDTILTFTAHNGAYTDVSQTFTLVSSSNTSAITSAPSVQIAAGKKVNFTVTTSGNPAATISTSGMPAWLQMKLQTGNHLGTAKLIGVGPSGGGNYTFTIDANNGFGPPTTQSFTVHVLAISSPATVSFSKTGGDGQSFTIQTVGAGAGVTLTATLTRNQAGLTFRDNGDGTATLYGQPSAAVGTHVLKVTATSGATHYTQKLAVGITS
jgi:hypothetical protein